MAKIGSAGVHFVKAHPLFKDLPGNVGMSLPYQALVHDGDHRLGLKLEGKNWLQEYIEVMVSILEQP